MTSGFRIPANVVAILLASALFPYVGGASRLSRAAEIKAAPPALEAHCFDCHGNGAREGDLALDELLSAEPSPATREQWRKTWKMVRQEFMPPVGADLLAPDDRKSLTRWIEEARLGVDYDRPDPGRVTMRRLNRMEYEFTVLDLFDVDVATVGGLASDSSTAETRLRDMLPPDDTAFGFDNIGDFQTLSPALLERYFDIAEFVVSQVIVVDGPWYPVKRLDRSDLEVERDEEPKRASHVANFEVERPGLYRVAVQFSSGGWQDYGGSYDFSFAVDEREPQTAALDVGGQETHTYSTELELDSGAHSLRLTTVAIKPDSDGRLRHLQLNPRIEVTGPLSADERSYPESHRRIFFEGEAPAAPAARRAYASAVLGRVANRAFRRPVDDATLNRLTDLALADDSFERGVGHGIVAVLTSPRFLFRTEVQPQPDDPHSVHPLDDYALASRLSYLLWLSLPDEELTELAAAGKLRENLQLQVARMLADSKSSRFIEDFAGQWLRTRNVLMTPVSRQRETIDPLRGAMKQETELLFEHIVRDNLDLMELVTADYTFLNDSLARYYGLPRVEGGEFRRVALDPASHRGGILTHGSFLTSTSNPDRTSPVKRGLFVLENLLATQPPAPPANVPPLEEAHADGKMLVTVREQLEAHRADPACAACHAHFDPIGVVLENYDVIGRWRDDERGAPIDPTAVTVSGDELAGIDDLREYIVENRERYYRCCAEKLMTYALGRGLEPYDAVSVDHMTAQLMTDGGKFSTLLAAVVESPAFETRRGDDAGDLQTAPRQAIPEIPPPDKRRPPPRRGRFGPFDRPRAGRPEPEAEAPTVQRDTNVNSEADDD